MNKFFYLITLLFLFSLSNNLYCQSNNFNKQTIKSKGIPYITNYYPKDYNAAAQNWAILQDKRGVMYIGNGNGLLEFDGNEWRLIQMPNKSLARSLAMDSDGKIYVGAQGELGYLEANKQGELEYKSLISKIPTENRNFEGVSKIYITDAGILFHTATAIYLYADNHFRVIKPKNKFDIGFYVHGKYYVNEKNSGLYYLDQGLMKNAKGGGFFKDKQIDLMLPFHDNKILITTRESGLYIYDPKSKNVFPSAYPNRYLKKWNSPLEKHLKSNPIYCGTELGSNFYLFGTLKNGLFVTDRKGNPIRHINEESGLQNDLVWSVNIDSQGNAWLGLDSGIAYVTLNSPFSYFNLEGSVLSTTIFNNNLYVGTTEGIWMKENRQKGINISAVSDFKFIKNTNEQAWYLTEIDGLLLAAHSKGIFQIKGNQAYKIAPDYTWTIRKLKQKNLYIAGTYNTGLIILEKKGNNIKVKKRITTFKESARYLEVGKNNNIWISHPYKGVYNLKLSENFDSILETKLYSSISGLPSDTYNFVFGLNEKIVFGTEKGVYQYDEKSNRFSEDKTFSKILGNKSLIRKLVQDKKGNIWYVSDGQIGFLNKMEDGSLKSEKNLFYKFRESEIYHITPIDNNNVYFGTPEGLIHYSPEIAKIDGSSILKPYPSFIRKVSGINIDSIYYGGTLSGNNKINNESKEYSYDQNSLKFTYAAAWFENIDQTQFQYYLKGFDDNWSNWTKNSVKEYTNLPAGEYTFLVRAKNVYEMVSAESTYSFTVLPPWYGTLLARAFYVLASIFIVWGIIRFRERQHVKEKEKLESIIKERTKEIVVQKNEIENKNVELEQQNEEISAQRENILKQNDELRDLNEEKNHLIGILAHDLRNPLHQIKGIAGIMKMKAEDISEDQMKYIEIIEGSADHLNNMIVKILDLEAIESDKTNLSIEKTNLLHTVNVIIDSFKDSAAKKDIQLVSNFGEEEYNAMVDKSFTSQVFENLVTNAIKFSPKSKNIYLNLDISDNKVRFEVKDEGPGLSEDDMKKLFGKFQKLSARPTGGEKSTGLGLSIVKKYVESMNGNVWCESEYGNGASFIVEFDAV